MVMQHATGTRKYGYCIVDAPLFVTYQFHHVVVNELFVLIITGIQIIMSGRMYHKQNFKTLVIKSFSRNNELSRAHHIPVGLKITSALANVAIKTL